MDSRLRSFAPALGAIFFPVAFVFLLLTPAAAQQADEAAPPPNGQDAPLSDAAAPPVGGVVLPGLLVEEKRAVSPVLSVTKLETSPVDASTSDTAGKLEGKPGAAVVRNGSQTGIVQLRGLANERVRIRVDGMSITPACPNHMDPPLHFLLPSDVGELDLRPGVTSVSEGGDSIAGSVSAVSKRPKLAAGEKWEPVFESHALYRSAEDGVDTGVTLGIANDRNSVAYRGQMLRGGSIRFPGGTIRDSGYESQDHSLRAVRRLDDGQVDFDIGFFDGDFAGTPALPMDIVKDEALRVNLALEHEVRFGTLHARVYRHAIDHRMDNFSERPPGMMRMYSPAETEDVGVSADLETEAMGGTWRVGTEVLANAHHAYQVNDMSGLEQDTFRDASRTRLGLFAEWETTLARDWTPSVGLRTDRVWSDAGKIEDFYGMSAMDAAAFNAEDHAVTRQHIDATASLRWDATSEWSVELSAARKTRSPSTLERYLWTPLSASAGQADGRTYLGNLHLVPEVSHQVNLAAMGQWRQVTVQPSAFYNRVHDYIQGTPIARKDMNGLPVLQYTNLEAELYGVEGTVTWRPAPDWRLGAVLSWVEGRNLDLDDDLYRIAPLSTTLDAEWKIGRFTNLLEVRVAGEQDDVSRTNGETTSKAWAVLNLRTAYEVQDGWTVRAGVENVTNNRYAEHLSGVNRVTDSDVAVGERLPAPGAFAYVGVEFRM
jgi:iron complex outermembrane receptor protein